MTPQERIEVIEAELTTLKQQVADEAYTYPLYKQDKLTGVIVKFTSLTKGITVWGDANPYITTSWVKHISLRWKDIAYDEDRDLWDTQPIYAWDNGYNHTRLIAFYDAVSNQAFTRKGNRGGFMYDHYEAIPLEEYTEWIMEAHKTLEN